MQSLISYARNDFSAAKKFRSHIPRQASDNAVCSLHAAGKGRVLRDCKSNSRFEREDVCRRCRQERAHILRMFGGPLRRSGKSPFGRPRWYWQFPKSLGRLAIETSSEPFPWLQALEPADAPAKWRAEHRHLGPRALCVPQVSELAVVREPLDLDSISTTHFPHSYSGKKQCSGRKAELAQIIIFGHNNNGAQPSFAVIYNSR